MSAIRLSIAATAVAGGLVVCTPALSADLGGGCCADLEARVAELEATAARKGNRKVSLTISGQINTMILAWDDGEERNAYVVSNNNDEPYLNITGEAEIAKGWKLGYELEIQFQQDLSGSVSQFTDDAGGGSAVWLSNVFVESDSLGKLTLGQASRATDGVPEADLSEASTAGYAGMQDIAGGFFLRRKRDGLTGVAWGDLIDHLNTDTADIVRYDTPSLMGFVASASWGEDDIWDVALRYTKDKGVIQVDAAAGYYEVTDNFDPDFGGPDYNTVIGSVSILHEPTGLNLTVAAGRRQFTQRVIDTDGNARTPDDAKYIYGKLGWIAQLSPLGNTAFYGEYGHFRDFASVGFDTDTVGSFGFGGFDCTNSGGACRLAGSTANVWGLGVVQHIDAAAMEVYLAYRNYSGDVNVVDTNGSNVREAEIDDINTLIAGSKIAF